MANRQRQRDRQKLWIVYDGRAAGGDTDDAAIMITCSSPEEARSIVRNGEFGDGCVFYQYDVRGKTLVNEIGPFGNERGGER